MKTMTAWLLAFCVVVPGFSFEKASVPGWPSTQDVSRNQTAPGRAEQSLEELARKFRLKRTIIGVIGGVAGVGSMALGFSAMNRESNNSLRKSFDTVFGTFFVIGGAAVTIVAIGQSFPSRAELEYRDILTVMDPDGREKAAVLSLEKLAKRGKTRRMIQGGLMAVFVIMAANQDLASAAIYGALGLSSFLDKSPEEKAYGRYLASIQSPQGLDPVIAFDPRGGFRFGFSLSF